MIPIVILAAGASRRMGGIDKVLLPVDGRPMIARQANMAAATDCPVFVAVRAGASDHIAALDGVDCTVLPIEGAEQGQSVSLRSAIAQLPPCAAFMVVLADLVKLQTDDLTAVIAARRAFPNALIWRGATVDGAPGHPVLFSSDLRGALKNLTGDAGADAIIRRHADQTHLIRFTDDRARYDIDTPQDWDRYRAFIS